MKLDNVSGDGQQCCMQSFKLCYLASMNPLTLCSIATVQCIHSPSVLSCLVKLKSITPLTLCLHCHSVMHTFTSCLIPSDYSQSMDPRMEAPLTLQDLVITTLQLLCIALSVGSGIICFKHAWSFLCKSQTHMLLLP